MRLVIIVLVISFIAPVYSQGIDEKTAAQQFVSNTLDRRENKSWDAVLFANKQTAADLGTINNIVVQVDSRLPDRTLVIRNKQPFLIHAGELREETIPAGSDMALQRW